MSMAAASGASAEALSKGSHYTRLVFRRQKAGCARCEWSSWLATSQGLITLRTNAVVVVVVVNIIIYYKLIIK